MVEKQLREDHQIAKHVERLLLRTIKRLINAYTSFTIQKIRNEAGLKHVSTRTINLNKHKYKYLQSRKKKSFNC